MNAVMTDVCGYDVNEDPIYPGEYVKVIKTDPNHKGDKKYKFCWAEESGMVIGPSPWSNIVLVKFGIPGEGIKKMYLLSGFLKIIKE